MELSPGLVRVDFRSDGPAPMRIEVQGPDGRRQLIAERVRGAGSVALYVRDPGEHLFDVAAEGVWELGVSPVRPDDARPLPARLNGNGTTVTAPFLVEDSVSVTVQFSGQGRLVLQPLAVTSSRSIEPVAIDAPGRSTHTIALESDTYVLAVDTVDPSARWTVELSAKAA
ncbi:MAG: hypothetical protein KY469_02850 [Actinobacteria bacterium]|nr:hypothetical protein [Actinomycetota bacterium]